VVNRVKRFFNDRGVAVQSTDICAQYPRRHVRVELELRFLQTPVGRCRHCANHDLDARWDPIQHVFCCAAPSFEVCLLVDKHSDTTAMPGPGSAA
jgi:hypothetical protein